MLNYMRKHCDMTIKKLTFEWEKNVIAATTNLKCMANGIISVSISYYTTYYLLYEEFLTLYPYP